jgi:hypothetical protein
LSSIWNYIEPWIDRQKFAFTTFSVLAGSWFLYSTITKDKVLSITDLRPINGTLSNYSFVHGERGRRKYYLWLKEYSSTFQIPADFISFFEKKTFETNAQIGQPLSIRISKFDEGKLRQAQSHIFIYDLQQGNRKYLDCSSTIKQENSPLFYYAGTGFILAGVGFYFYKKRQLRRDYR